MMCPSGMMTEEQGLRTHGRLTTRGTITLFDPDTILYTLSAADFFRWMLKDDS
jgi:hypothetical protein